MGALDVGRTMLRRWYVTAAVLLAATLVTSTLLQSSGVYSTRTVVAFSFPDASMLLPDSGVANASVISFAGAIAEDINNGRPAARYASTDAPYYGAGVREGVLVTLPDSGGQWATSYARAEIEIQIVGRSYEWVEAKQSALLARVMEQTSARQESAGAPAMDYITATIVPLTSLIASVGPSSDVQIAAVGSMALASMLAAGWASLWFDRVGTAAIGHPRVRKRGQA